jgi:hypothetical protein
LFAYVYQLRRHTTFDTPVDELMPLAALARRLVPEDIRNIVVPGRVGTAGRASVVYLNQSAATAIFDDLRPDGVLGGAGPEKGTTTSSSSSSTSSTSTSSSTSSTVATPTTAPSGVTSTSFHQPSVTSTTTRLT